MTQRNEERGGGRGRQDLSEMSVEQLRQMAREQQITGFSSMRKQQLVEALQQGGERSGGRSRGMGEEGRERRAG